ncbi:VOC family protein [Gilvimarinus sp. SDUM040013]|uniref:VOC family protein n=1 Tax=Gilvimarinus gilvus TaxID=3058038 RepID=A0ABU4RY45_9GAMM|nr:VOC family protein [Gilvimarinus sp. SDUM040013]MDO3386181.1 VOC family protein [Gilvimarinus sp. SDUM040013]MDX6849824.1 VOC family protein [Gilvimarinus sp. SDUM040013]
MKIDHVAIYTANFERARHFYCDHFGFRAGERYQSASKPFESYFLEAESGARLELMWREGLEPRATNNGELTGISHIALNLGSQQAVVAMFERLQGAGCRVVSGPRQTGDGYFEACVYDLDGNRIEVTA